MDANMIAWLLTGLISGFVCGVIIGFIMGMFFAAYGLKAQGFRVRNGKIYQRQDPAVEGKK